MAYNTKIIKKDRDGNPIPQYYNKTLDEYEPATGKGGSTAMVLYNEDGTVNEDSISIAPIVEKLERLSGTIIDESTRKADELARINNENERLSAEDIRVSNEDSRKSSESQRVVAENTRVDNENTRQSQETNRVSDEGIRKSQEITRETNENLRIALYDDLQSKLAGGFFKGEKGDTGNGLEYTWNGTQLGIRVEGTTQYVYVDLKGEKGDTGSIDSLDSTHIESALGFLPKDYVAGQNITIDDNVINAEGEEITLESIVQALGYTPLKELDIENKVDKVAGKALSTNDFDNASKDKLDGIEANANKYEHPSTHPASMITESTTKRFVSDTEKNKWNKTYTDLGTHLVDYASFKDDITSKIDGARINLINSYNEIIEM